MACEYYDICDFANHISKMAKLAKLSKEYKPFDEELKKECSGNAIGQIYYNGTIDTIECPYSEIECCPRFPDCVIVNSRQILFPNDLESLCLQTCTSLGLGVCSEMLTKDANIIMSGGTNITFARSVRNKFKGL